MPGRAEFVTSGDSRVLEVGGDWTLSHYRALSEQVRALSSRMDADARVEFGQLGALDTAGASLLSELLGAARLAAVVADASGLPAERRALLQTVAAALQESGSPARTSRGSTVGDVLAHIGLSMITFRQHVIGLAGFVGLTLETAFHVLPRPRRWRVTAVVAHLERTAFDAVPIVALLTFLVGAVVAFLGATVLAEFGASIFTVDLIAFSFLREFGVLLTAILVAGRTASAFSAQIGSMRANEEVDAIRVLGLAPIEMLVLPRVIALLLALPMLTFVAMISGIAGGMVVCALTLDISPTMFISVVESNVTIRHFFVGMAKAPIFAFLIAVIGCHEGFKASGSAQSVGEHTTSAVVQSIFVVIVVDAVAALFCMQMGW